MHGTITLRPAYDRAEIARRAWRLWKLAQDVAARGPYDPFGRALTGLGHAARLERINQDFREREVVRGIACFGDAMRRAWAQDKRRVEIERERAEDAARPVHPLIFATEFDRRRFFAEMSDDDTVRRRELRRIAEDEALAAREAAHV